MYKTLDDVPEELKKDILNMHGQMGAGFKLYWGESNWARALDLMRGFPDVWPEGATQCCQDRDGFWTFSSYSSAYPLSNGGWQGVGEGEWFRMGSVKGSIIGDWRTTLRKRPELSEKTPTISDKESVSDGSTASYYELPEGATQLQHLISYRNLNAQDGEIFRAIYRKGRASHSDELRDAKKVLFYAQAEVERLEALK